MQESSSIFEPLKNRAFLIYWLAGISANFGWQIQLVGASWLMTSLGGSSQMVALVQTTVALPVMLLSLPGGAISDMLGTRTMVLWSQTALMVVSVLLAIFAWFDGLNSVLLLVFTFLIGSGRALYYPGWQAMVVEFVSRREVTGAIAVNAGGLNIARTVGPALGGAIVAAIGAYAAFIINALSNLSVIFIALRWKKHRASNDLPPEAFGSAILTGARYVALSPVLISIVSRATIFNIAAISVIALMPLVARDLLGGGAQTYGILLGSFGAGALVGTVLLDFVRRRTSLESCTALFFVGFATGATLLGYSENIVMSMLATALAGCCWIIVQVNLNSAMQLSSPRWVLSRSNGVYQTFIFGGNALGSLIWGLLADCYGLSTSLAVSGAVLIGGAAMGFFFRLADPAEGLGLDPHGQWNAPTPALAITLASGPILTTIEYRIDEPDLADFLKAMDEKRRNRVRDGARQWSLSRDIQDPGLWIERFSISTWAETKRHHSRRTIASEKLNEFIRGLHREAQSPKVRYELAQQPGPGRKTAAPILPRPDY